MKAWVSRVFIRPSPDPILNKKSKIFHMSGSNLEFSLTFLMLTSKKNIDKIESLQKKTIRLLMGWGYLE